MTARIVGEAVRFPCSETGSQRLPYNPSGLRKRESLRRHAVLLAAQRWGETLRAREDRVHPKRERRRRACPDHSRGEDGGHARPALPHLHDRVAAHLPRDAVSRASRICARWRKSSNASGPTSLNRPIPIRSAGARSARANGSAFRWWRFIIRISCRRICAGRRGRLGKRGAALTMRAAQAYVRQFYNRFAATLVPSAQLANVLREWGVTNTRTVELGVNTDVFQPGAGCRGDAQPARHSAAREAPALRRPAGGGEKHRDALRRFRTARATPPARIPSPRHRRRPGGRAFARVADAPCATSVGCRIAPTRPSWRNTTARPISSCIPVWRKRSAWSHSRARPAARRWWGFAAATWTMIFCTPRISGRPGTASARWPMRWKP